MPANRSRSMPSKLNSLLVFGMSGNSARRVLPSTVSQPGAPTGFTIGIRSLTSFSFTVSGFSGEHTIFQAHGWMLVCQQKEQFPCRQGYGSMVASSHWLFIARPRFIASRRRRRHKPCGLRLVKPCAFTCSPDLIGGRLGDSFGDKLHCGQRLFPARLRMRSIAAFIWSRTAFSRLISKR